MLHSHGKVGTFYNSDDMDKYPGFCLILFDKIALICNSGDGSIGNTEFWTDPVSIGWVKVG